MEEEKILEKPKKDIISIVLRVIIIIVLFLIFVTMTTHLSLKRDIDGYKEVYPEYDKRYYYYDKDNDKVSISSIKDIYSNDIKLSKMNKIPLLYCKEDTCIYVNLSRMIEKIYLNPKGYISILILLVLILEFILLNRKDLNKRKYLIITIIVILITSLSIFEEVRSIVGYYSTVNKNRNLVHAINIGNREDNSFAFKYTVDNKLYYFSSNDKNNTIYYKKSNPSIASNKTNPFNIIILIIDLIYIVYLFILRKNKMKRISQEGETTEK